MATGPSYFISNEYIISRLLCRLKEIQISGGPYIIYYHKTHDSELGYYAISIYREEGTFYQFFLKIIMINRFLNDHEGHLYIYQNAKMNENYSMYQGFGQA